MRYWTRVEDRLDGPWEARQLLDLRYISRDTLICPETKLGEWVKLGLFPELEVSIYLKEIMESRGRVRDEQQLKAYDALRQSEAELSQVSSQLASKSQETEMLKDQLRDAARVTDDFQHLQTLLDSRSENLRLTQVRAEELSNEKADLERRIQEGALSLSHALQEARQWEEEAKLQERKADLFSQELTALRAGALERERRLEADLERAREQRVEAESQRHLAQFNTEALARELDSEKNAFVKRLQEQERSSSRQRDEDKAAYDELREESVRQRLQAVERGRELEASLEKAERETRELEARLRTAESIQSALRLELAEREETHHLKQAELASAVEKLTRELAAHKVKTLESGRKLEAELESARAQSHDGYAAARSGLMAAKVELLEAYGALKLAETRSKALQEESAAAHAALLSRLQEEEKRRRDAEARQAATGEEALGSRRELEAAQAKLLETEAALRQSQLELKLGEEELAKEAARHHEAETFLQAEQARIREVLAESEAAAAQLKTRLNESLAQLEASAAAVPAPGTRAGDDLALGWKKVENRLEHIEGLYGTLTQAAGPAKAAEAKPAGRLAAMAIWMSWVAVVAVVAWVLYEQLRPTLKSPARPVSIERTVLENEGEGPADVPPAPWAAPPTAPAAPEAKALPKPKPKEISEPPMPGFPRTPPTSAVSQE